mgnify:FL=1
MNLLKNLQSAFRAVHPPCARCPYRLGLVVFVQSPCPACRANGYRTFDALTNSRVTFPNIWCGGMFRDGADDGKIFRR